MPPPGAGGFPGGADGGPTMFRFNTRSPDDIFSEIFGFSSPFGGMGDMGGSRAGASGFPRGMFGEDIFASLRGGAGEGWKKGTKITFPEKGNEQRGVIPSDLVFIIDEKPHGVFKRDGNDLVVTQKISLVEALTGYTAQLTTLDGRNLTVPINNVISPTYEEVVKASSSLPSLRQSRKLA
ncbi:Chaperone DnaJ [Theobroma cacao]|nr:Chaperone DnaJ [Theobroma cacao]